MENLIGKLIVRTQPCEIFTGRDFNSYKDYSYMNRPHLLLKTYGSDGGMYMLSDMFRSSDLNCNWNDGNWEEYKGEIPENFQVLINNMKGE